MSADTFVRTPAIFTDIGTITSEYAGRRFRIMGFVVDRREQSEFTISDDTGRITVITDQPPTLQSFVRVFGSIAVSEEGQPLFRAEIIQDMTALDKQLYIEAKKIFDAALSGRSS